MRYESCVLHWKLNDEAYAAHQVCLEVQDKVASMTAPGVVCEDLYNAAIEIVTKAGFADRFMGVSQQARFIGHGIGWKSMRHQCWLRVSGGSWKREWCLPLNLKSYCRE